MNHEHHGESRTIRSKITVFLRQDPYTFAVVTYVASDGLRQYRAGVLHQGCTSVASTLILVVAEHLDDGILPLLRSLPPSLQSPTMTLSSLG